MKIRTIDYKKNKIKIIDQTKLPLKLKYLYISDVKKLLQAIKQLKIRGAPALGAAAALGVYLGIKDSKARDFKNFIRQLDKVASFIGSSRPTARNLFWGIERMKLVANVYQSENAYEDKVLIVG